jgi:hypothetical protein
MNAADQLSSSYRELVETASLDWQVSQYVRLERAIPDHSANEVKAAAIREISGSQHGFKMFDKAVANY